jgi:hypothetical protein
MASSLQRLAGYQGSYSRFGEGTASTTGILTERDYEVVDEQGMVTLVKSHDWLFTANDLEAAGLLPPEVGDRWQLTMNSGMSAAQQQDLESKPYEAMEIGNRPCFETHDGQGVMIVVHMKRVAGE